MSAIQSTSTARAKLQDIFQSRTGELSDCPLFSAGRTRDHDEALAILTLHPSLAAEKFSQRYLRWHDRKVECNVPLFWFVLTSASFSHIEAVWKLHPKITVDEVLALVREMPNTGRGSYVETTLFLLEKQPQALFRDALFASLVYKTSLFSVEAIIAIMELDRDNSHGLGYRGSEVYPIAEAMRVVENHDLLSYMAMRFPRNLDSLFVADCLPGGCAHLVGLLPQLKKLVLCNPRWTVETTTAFASKLQSTAFLENFSLSYTTSWPPATVQALVHGFSGNCSIKVLGLTQRKSYLGEEPQGDNLQLLSAGISEMKHLECLSLNGLQFAADTLLKFVASGSAPKKLCLDGCYLLPSHGSDLIADEDWERCSVEHLFVFLKGEGGCQEVVEVFLCKIPMLRNFTMQCNGLTNFTDISSGLNSALKRPTLENLEFIGAVSDTRGFCEALKTNSSLRTCALYSHRPWAQNDESKLVDVLSSSNTTLERLTLKDHYNIAQRPTIDYWTRLNEFGRGKARAPSTLPDEFVLLLSNAAEKLSPLNAFNVHYGLLRELPGNWSSRGTMQKIQIQQVKGENSDGKATPMQF